MQKKTANQRVVADDIRRYKKNGLGQMLALLGLVFNCLYLMLLYSFNHADFYSINIGISVLINLIYLLACFLCSEGVKAYEKKYCYVLLVLAVLQIVRIFGLPTMGLKNGSMTTLISGGQTVGRDYFGIELSQSAAFTLLLVYLIGSIACFVASAVYSYIVSVQHEKHIKALEDGTVDVDAVLKEMDREDEEAAKASLDAQPVETTEEVQ